MFYKEKITIDNTYCAFIPWHSSYRMDSTYCHSIYYDKKMIGGFVIIHAPDTIQNNEMNDIKILRKFGNLQFINLLCEALLDYLDQHYSEILNYIIKSDGINYPATYHIIKSNSTNYFITDYYTENHPELENMFVDCFMNNFYGRYYCNSLMCSESPFGYFTDIYTDTNTDSQLIILSKYKSNTDDDFNKNHVCDLILSHDDNTKVIHSNYSTHVLKHLVSTICKRKFRVTKETRFTHKNSDFPYTIIKISIDKPIILMNIEYDKYDVYASDNIYIKFFVNGFDYTSQAGLPLRLSSDTLNDEYNSYMRVTMNDHDRRLTKICGFSYFASNEDYLNYHFSSKVNRSLSDFSKAQDPYSYLHTTVNDIYRDFAEKIIL
jgi:hypothetical protein